MTEYAAANPKRRVSIENITREENSRDNGKGVERGSWTTTGGGVREDELPRKKDKQENEEWLSRLYGSYKPYYELMGPEAPNFTDWAAGVLSTVARSVPAVGSSNSMLERMTKTAPLFPQWVLDFFEHLLVHNFPHLTKTISSLAEERGNFRRIFEVSSFRGVLHALYAKHLGVKTIFQKVLPISEIQKDFQIMVGFKDYFQGLGMQSRVAFMDECAQVWKFSLRRDNLNRLFVFGMDWKNFIKDKELKVNSKVGVHVDSYGAYHISSSPPSPRSSKHDTNGRGKKTKEIPHASRQENTTSSDQKLHKENKTTLATSQPVDPGEGLHCWSRGEHQVESYLC